MMTETNNPDNPDIQVFPIARMDRVFLVSTWLVVLLLGGVFAALVLTGLKLSGGGRWGLWSAAAVTGVILLAMPLMVHIYARPRCLEISSEGLRIVWPGRSRKLPKGAFTEMKLVTQTDLGRMIRRFGVGGLFGGFGWFHSEYMGNMDAYITRRDKLVYLRMKNRRPLLLSPQNPREFIEAIQAVVKPK